MQLQRLILKSRQTIIDDYNRRQSSPSKDLTPLHVQSWVQTLDICHLNQMLLGVYGVYDNIK